MPSYRSLYLGEIAEAYGLSVATLRRNIVLQIGHTKTAASLVARLGTWEGKRLLLPEQVSAIVEMLGEPMRPENIYANQ